MLNMLSRGLNIINNQLKMVIQCASYRLHLQQAFDKQFPLITVNFNLIIWTSEFVPRSNYLDQRLFS